MSWSENLVSHLSKQMCRRVVKYALAKLEFNPPKVEIFNHTPEGYYDHNSYYNYVRSFLERL